MKRLFAFCAAAALLCSLSGCVSSVPGGLSAFIVRFNQAGLCEEIYITDFVSYAEDDATKYLRFFTAADDELLLTLTTNDSKQRICSVELTYDSKELSAASASDFYGIASASAAAFCSADEAEVKGTLAALGLTAGKLDFTKEADTKTDDFRFYWLPTKAGGSLIIECSRLVEEIITEKPTIRQ